MAPFRIIGCLFILLYAMSGLSQIGKHTPLIPDGSFEAVDTVFTRWYFDNRDFNELSRYWNSATTASPDLYFDAAVIPDAWKAEGFGSKKAADGRNYVGITVFGCKGGKTHCREYVQTPLIERLIPGQRYILQLKICHLSNTIHTNNIGACFSPDLMNYDHDSVLNIIPFVNTNRIIYDEKGRWMTVRWEFEALREDGYLIIGNFFHDDSTKKITPPASLPFGYYFIDDVSLEKLPPVLPGKGRPSYPPKEKFMIYFDYDSDRLDKVSKEKLKNVLQYLHFHPSLKLDLKGHTDADGTDHYNIDLSQRRINSVATYLVKHGYDNSRWQKIPKGETEPIADNSTEQGKQRNRRVELVFEF